jgi:hypothetical protein
MWCFGDDRRHFHIAPDRTIVILFEMQINQSFSSMAVSWRTVATVISMTAWRCCMVTAVFGCSRFVGASSVSAMTASLFHLAALTAKIQYYKWMWCDKWTRCDKSTCLSPIVFRSGLKESYRCILLRYKKTSSENWARTCSECKILLIQVKDSIPCFIWPTDLHGIWWEYLNGP